MSRQSTKVARVCEQCSAGFEIPRSWLRKAMTQGRFCSRACHAAFKSSETLESRLARWSAPPNENGCILWLGSISIHGYGYISYQKEARMFAHRAAYIAAYGEIPAGLVVMHKCDVRACINPDHLKTGTHQENSDDAVSKGRMRHGENHTEAKLTEANVLEIRRLWATGQHTQKAIGAMFGVSGVLVGLIVRRKAWKHLS